MNCRSVCFHLRMIIFIGRIGSTSGCFRFLRNVIAETWPVSVRNRICRIERYLRYENSNLFPFAVGKPVGEGGLEKHLKRKNAGSKKRAFPFPYIGTCRIVRLIRKNVTDAELTKVTSVTFAERLNKHMLSFRSNYPPRLTTLGKLIVFPNYAWLEVLFVVCDELIPDAFVFALILPMFINGYIQTLYWTFFKFFFLIPIFMTAVI